jgi:hypothetical protein
MRVQAAPARFASTHERLDLQVDAVAMDDTMTAFQ